MKNSDLQYLCRSIGSLIGIPIRIYRSDSLIFFYSSADLPKDPIGPYLERVLEKKEGVGYFITPHFNYYGTVRTNDYTVVIGPARQTQMSDKDIRELAFACDVDASRVDEFISAVRSLVEMPLGSLLEVLCTMNYILNGEKLSLEDVSIYDLEQINIEAEIENDRFKQSYEEYGEEKQKHTHNTLGLEQRLMQMISNGDVGALCEWMSHAPGVRGGVIANDSLRQLKNTFIVTATLASRAAIKGGMDTEDALSLSDGYIKKCELLTSVDAIVNLQYHMVLDYARKVERVRLGKQPSKLLMQVTNYVQHNLSKPLDVDGLAKSLYMSRTHLASKFKKECGMTLTDFILREKIEEAKRLLKYSDKPLSVIAEYLGFSSQSHFTKAFKKYTSVTPRKYRDNSTD